MIRSIAATALLGCLTALPFFVGASAVTVVLPPVQHVVNCLGGTPVVSLPDTAICQVDVPKLNLFGIAHAQATLTPSVSADASVTSGDLISLAGRASLLFYVEVLGPAGSQVMLNITSKGLTQGASAGASTSWGRIACSGFACPPGSHFPSSWSAVDQYGLPANLAVQMQLSVSAASDVNLGPSRATIDPFFALDPSTVHPELYTILFSPGILNTPPPPSVPEPSTVMMVLLGLLSAFWSANRRARSISPRLPILPHL